MAMREMPITFCPVPSEQQPVNEYEHLKQTWLFSWATLNLSAYCWKFLGLGLWSGILIGPIAAASFPPSKFPLLFAVATSVGITAILSLVLLRILLGWYYVRDRLQSEQIFYEESGWYDGQTWQKPPEILTRDRLIVSYQIDPMLYRLKQTGFIFLVTILLGTAICGWL
jgi:hypothetical protein